MCGLLGGINFPQEKFAAAKELLKHRGPDETGDLSFANLYLFHSRLGIQDIANGQQPFHYLTSSIIFNGEIYNHFDIRRTYNLECKTRSDTETILLLYKKIGLMTPDLLDGMFAFAIFDSASRDLLLCRDRAGEKPLYIYKAEDKFAFSSELNSLASVIEPELEYENIYQYLRYCFVSEKTPYKNVIELPAGSWYKINIDSLKVEQGKWWSVETYYAQNSKLSIDETKDHVNQMLQESVSRRITNSDLEVGTFLSGGIDSGLVTAISSKFKDNLKTFTIAFEGQYDESGLAEMVSKKYRTVHSTIKISFSDLKNDLEKILSNYGEPFSDSSAIPSYYVSREAKKNLTVILNGDGADELFGGYRRYVPFSKFDFFSGKDSYKGIFRLISASLPYPTHKKQFYNYLYRFFDFAGKAPLASYLSATIDSFEGYEQNFLSPENPFTTIQDKIKYLNEVNLSGLKKIMCLDFNYLFANDLLVKMDIATMAHSLEARTPFLSKDIMEFAPSINDSLKIRGASTKYILRELAKEYLPKELVHQPKRGFEVPLLKWIEYDLKEIVHDYLSGQTISETFVKREFIRGMLDKKIKIMPEKRAKMLWTLLALEIWYRKCYKKL